ncbi:DUF3052 family protein [Tropicimonas marinistellae]|uniref:DUF3052 family protein n=1 Tax=Tropicimonas marinistellae TaxID=1739787 RepID=UPI00082D4355|nr:DUF3052 family protein [Tropicimonas marinistellae]
MAGYSGKPLAEKLGLRVGDLSVAVGAPQGYVEMLGEMGRGVRTGDAPVAGAAFIHLFAARRDALETLIAQALAAMDRHGMIWVSWPKRASKVPTDVTEDVIREIALPLGLVDVKVCAVDEVWSGLKLVIRKELR